VVSQRVRFEVLSRDGYRCGYCGAPGNVDAELQIDHVVPRAAGGTDKPSNLLTACGPCNQGKADTHPAAQLINEVAHRQLRWERLGRWQRIPVDPVARASYDQGTVAAITALSTQVRELGGDLVAELLSVASEDRARGNANLRPLVQRITFEVEKIAG
jgi:hypothetical protein